MERSFVAVMAGGPRDGVELAGESDAPWQGVIWVSDVGDDEPNPGTDFYTLSYRPLVGSAEGQVYALGESLGEARFQYDHIDTP